MPIIIEYCPQCKRNNWDTSGTRCLDCGYQKPLDFTYEADILYLYSGWDEWLK